MKSRAQAGTTVTRVAVPALAVAVAVVGVLRAVRRRHRAKVTGGGYEDREVRRQIVVDLDRTHVYWLCREPARVAASLDPAVRVVRVDDRWSQWVVPLPNGLDHLLTVEVVGDIPELLVAWRVADNWLPHEGTVRLAEAGPDRTELSVSLRYRWTGDDDPVDAWLERALERVATAAVV
jgi:uncharacterized membrane protein